MQENTTTPKTDEEIIDICLDAFKTKSSCAFDYAVVRYTAPIKPFVKIIQNNAEQDFEDDIFVCKDMEPEHKNSQILIVNKANKKDWVEKVNCFFADELINRHEFTSDGFRAYAFIFFEKNERQSIIRPLPFRTFMISASESPCKGRVLKEGDEGYEDVLRAYISYCMRLNDSAELDYAVFDFPGSAKNFVQSAVDEWEDAENFQEIYGFSFIEYSKFVIVNTKKDKDFFEKMDRLYDAFYWTEVGLFGQHKRSGSYTLVCQRSFYPCEGA